MNLIQVSVTNTEGPTYVAATQEEAEQLLARIPGFHGVEEWVDEEPGLFMVECDKQWSEMLELHGILIIQVGGLRLEAEML